MGRAVSAGLALMGLALAVMLMGAQATRSAPAAPGAAPPPANAGSAPIPAGSVAPGNPLACKPEITQGYGFTPYERPHHGIDYSCAEGTPEIAVVEGQVVQSTGGCPPHGSWQNGCGGGYGNHLVIGLVTDIGAGPHKYFVLYAHMESEPAFAVGAQVKVGQTVGLEGSSGWSSGPHLHFEVDQDALNTTKSINPSPFVAPELRVPTT